MVHRRWCSNNVFTGTLEKFRSGQCISCTYNGRPSSAGNDGAITITFMSPASASCLCQVDASRRSSPRTSKLLNGVATVRRIIAAMNRMNAGLLVAALLSSNAVADGPALWESPTNPSAIEAKRLEPYPPQRLRLFTCKVGETGITSIPAFVAKPAMAFRLAIAVSLILCAAAVWTAGPDSGIKCGDPATPNSRCATNARTVLSGSRPL